MPAGLNLILMPSRRRMRIATTSGSESRCMYRRKASLLHGASGVKELPSGEASEAG